MLDKNPDMGAVDRWSDDFPIRPITLDGKVMVRVEREGAAPELYTLWRQEGPSGKFDQPVLFNQAQLNESIADVMDVGRDALAGDRTSTKEKVHIHEATGKVLDVELQHFWVDPKAGPNGDRFKIIADPADIKNAPQEWWIEAEKTKGLEVGDTVTREIKYNLSGYRYGHAWRLNEEDTELFNQSRALRKIMSDQKPAILINAPKAALKGMIEQKDVSTPEPTMAETFAAAVTPTPPKPKAPLLPNTKLQISNLAALSALDFSKELGGVSAFLATSKPTGKEIKEWKIAVEEGRTAINSSLETISKKLQEYYKNGRSAEIERDIIKQVQNVPDGYKAIAIAFVMDTLDTKKPLPTDDYKHKAEFLYMDERYIDGIKNELLEKRHHHNVENIGDSIRKRWGTQHEGVLDTIITASDSKKASEIFGTDATNEQLLSEFKLASAGDNAQTIKMDDGKTYVHWQKMDEGGDIDYTLINQDDLQILWNDAYEKEMIEVTASPDNALNHFKNFGAFSKHIEEGRAKIVTGKPDYDYANKTNDAEFMNDMNPAMLSAVLRHNSDPGFEEAAEASENNLTTKTEANISAIQLTH